MTNNIKIIGARHNNLKNVTLDIPKGKLTVFTGVSGSGKSSLVFDTLYSEGQRKFNELLEVNNYQSKGIAQANVQEIKGLSPVVALKQKTSQKNPRSTVGTVTKTLHMLQALFALDGISHCPYCGCNLFQVSNSKIVSELMKVKDGYSVELRTPIYRKYAQNYESLIEDVKKLYINNISIDGIVYRVSELPELKSDHEYAIEIILDRFSILQSNYKQIVKNLDMTKAMLDDNMMLILHLYDENGEYVKEHDFFTNLGCCEHHSILLSLQASHFSFNNPVAACDTCLGLGVDAKAYPEFMVLDPEKSISKGALHKGIYSLIPDSLNGVILYSLSVKYGFSLDEPYKDLSDEVKDIIMYGTKGEEIEMINPPAAKKKSYIVGTTREFGGFVADLEKQHRELMFRRTNGDNITTYTFEDCLVECECPMCKGGRLKPQFLNVTFQGNNIFEYTKMSIDKLKKYFGQIGDKEDISENVRVIVRDLNERLDTICETGVSYLNIGRRMDSVSGGEAQRIKLSGHIGSDLMGLVYILDEPSTGLHARDVSRLIRMLNRLRDKGNTVVVVEHELEVIKNADYIVEIGPRAGRNGGNVVAQGTLAEMWDSDKSITAPYIKNPNEIPIPSVVRKPNGQYLRIINACENNLKNISLDIPLHMLVCVSGVSGSGKSTLINETLVNYLLAKKYSRKVIPGRCQKIEGIEYLNNVINIDQSQIGTSKSSTVATYMGFFDYIRQIFAGLEEYCNRGYTAQDFSLTSKNGLRCFNCNGEGVKVIKMKYMPEIESICTVCKGEYYSEEGLRGKYKGKNIADVLKMSVIEAKDFFADNKSLCTKMEVMVEFGLGYLLLGQKTSSISGGEAQRLKLCYELSKKKGNKDNLYIFDEPSVGLHSSDVACLLNYIERLVNAGNSVIVIEHNLDIIKSADYVIDIGPDGGEEGGQVVAQGTPYEIAHNENSVTGRYLKMFLN